VAWRGGGINNVSGGIVTISSNENKWQIERRNRNQTQKNMAAKEERRNGMTKHEEI